MPPAVGQVPDHPKAPPPAGALTPRAACEAVSVIEYPAVDAAVDAQVEHDRGVVLRGAVDDPVRHELGDHQHEVVKQRARDARGQFFRDDAPGHRRTLQLGLDLVEGTNA